MGRDKGEPTSGNFADDIARGREAMHGFCAKELFWISPEKGRRDSDHCSENPSTKRWSDRGDGGAPFLDLSGDWSAGQ
ncbi:hypothetical protein MRB53_020769 [Persea americana]|uniref:Uncharacterized protein n=1 Tax=Persea americana TaxID=3435 RepID=A0ACC2L1V1_PERAE|nr:hypothetical protein MRB53_020769 [Persea americana]